MSAPVVMRVRAAESAPIEDPMLVELDEAALAEGRAKTRGLAAREIDPDEPYDLEPIQPQAYSLRKLYADAGRVPAQIEAAVGRATVPLLLAHGVSLFRRNGADEGLGVWVIGYEVKPLDVEASTLAVSPDTTLEQVAQVDQDVTLGISAGGEIAVPSAALKAIDAVPGVSLQGATLAATTDTRFGLSVRYVFSLLRVQSAPIGAGGARWDLYRRGDQIYRFQPLIQTLLIPPAIGALTLEVTTWVCRRGIFFGKLGARRWRAEPYTVEVSVEGLEA